MVSSKLLPGVSKRVRFANLTYFVSSFHKDRSTTFWFLSGRHIRMHGGGTINGNGQVWYDALSGNGVRDSLPDRSGCAMIFIMLFHLLRTRELQGALLGRLRGLFRSQSETLLMWR